MASSALTRSALTSYAATVVMLAHPANACLRADAANRPRVADTVVRGHAAAEGAHPTPLRAHGGRCDKKKGVRRGLGPSAGGMHARCWMRMGGGGVCWSRVRSADWSPYPSGLGLRSVGWSAPERWSVRWSVGGRSLSRLGDLLQVLAMFGVCLADVLQSSDVSPATRTL